jgi:EpsI family protein
MIARRDLLLGGACLAGVGLGYAVTPHRRLNLMGGKKFAQIIPANVPGWVSRDASDLAPPVEQGGEVDRIYDELVERIYTSKTTGEQIMMLIAHGPLQTNELMLHRPEKCYPANGFSIKQSQPVRLNLGAGAVLPAREVVADSHDGRENILYWTRLGEDLPTSNREQRATWMVQVLHGYVSDGVLARFSVIAADPNRAMATLKAFIPAFLQTVSPKDRRTLIGTSRSNLLAGVSRT